MITLHALGIEKYQLQNLYKTREIPEVVFTKLIQRVSFQIRRVQSGDSQIQIGKNIKPKKDIFEKIGKFVIDRLEVSIEPIKAQYLEIRATHIVIKRVLE